MATHIVTCRCCQSPFSMTLTNEEETVWQMLGLTRPLLPQLCEPCAQASAEKRQQEQARQFAAKRAADWEALCPPQMRQTLQTKLPNLGATARVLSWRKSARGIIAHGPTGRGKTRSIWLLLRELHFGNPPMLISAFGVQEWLDRVSAMFGQDPGEAERWLRQQSSVDVLFLDDLDKAAFTERTEAELLRVFNARGEHALPTFFTTQMVGDELAGMFSSAESGAAFVRRLRELCLPIAF